MLKYDSNFDKLPGQEHDSSRIFKEKAFRVSLCRYASGEDVDVARFYDEVEALILVELSEGKEKKDRYKRMVEVLTCVEGNINKSEKTTNTVPDV